MARFRKVKLDVFRQYQNTKTIIKKKNMGQNRFTKRSNFKKFQLSNFTLNSVRPRKKNSVGVIQKCNLVCVQHIIFIENTEVSPLNVYPTHFTLS